MRRSPGALFWAGAGILAACMLLALLAPTLAPYDPRLPTELPLHGPTAGHLLGTGVLGQDVLSQLLYGARTSLLIAAVVTLISTGLSWLLGVLAGAVRLVEVPLMALADVLLALPGLPLYLLILTLLGPSQRVVILVLALTSWPDFARIVRSLVAQAREAPYIEAARALGASSPRLVWRHLLPATLDVLPTKVILTVRFAVFTEATLAFLGLGQGRGVSWGTMLSLAFDDPLLFSRPVWPWLVLPPALAIMLVLLATAWLSTGIGGRLTFGHDDRARVPLPDQPDTIGQAGTLMTGERALRGPGQQPAMLE